MIEQLERLFQRSPSLNFFEECYVPEFRETGFCSGYYWEDDMMVYAITLPRAYTCTVYRTDAEMKPLGCYATVNEVLPAFEIFSKVQLQPVQTEDVGEYEVIGLQWISGEGWMYTIDYGATKMPCCADELVRVG